MNNSRRAETQGSNAVKAVAVDIRCLAESHQSGVGEYVQNILQRLPARTPELEYRCFFNRAKPARLTMPAASNVTSVIGRVPSKLLNTSVRLFGFPHLDKRCQAGVVFLPSLQSVSLTKPSRLLVTIHDLSFERYPEFFSRKARLWHRLVNPRKLCRRADFILALSEHTKQELVDVYHVPPERITVTYLGVNSVFLNPVAVEKLAIVRQKYRLPERYVLSLGNLEPRKNFRSVIDAFHRVPTDASLVIVGRPVYRAEELYRRAAEGVAAGRIRFLGYVDAADRPALYRMATCFVYPSYYEGFGLPVLEAMASGTPVIASSATCLPEVVGDAGLLVDPYDVNDIAAAIETLLNDNQLRERLRTKGKLRAQQFTWEKTAEQTAEVIRRLVSG